MLVLSTNYCYGFFCINFSLQVQNDHYEEFFAPELDKHGYQALFKRKTNEVVKELFVSSNYIFSLLYLSLADLFSIPTFFG